MGAALTVIGRTPSAGEQPKGLLLKRPGGPFAGGKFARRAFRRFHHSFKRRGVYVINSPAEITAQLAQQG